jgi:hypothetical protein
LTGDWAGRHLLTGDWGRETGAGRQLLTGDWGRSWRRPPRQVPSLVLGRFRLSRRCAGPGRFRRSVEARQAGGEADGRRSGADGAGACGRPAGPPGGTEAQAAASGAEGGGPWVLELLGRRDAQIKVGGLGTGTRA